MQKMIVPQDAKNAFHGKPISKKLINKESIEAMTPETDKMVTGTFVNIECQGQPAKVSAKLYKGMQYFTRLFKDGERCTIPLSVARFINERITYEKHGYLVDADGNPIKEGKSQSRYKFMIESLA